ncbi:MAG: ABC transporter transmembrane domain-containing protein, partial [Anaerolineae bacterium]|nr:ABC transporter transmembrane domain-containing protein [Anaerolineae bacterium]
MSKREFSIAGEYQYDRRSPLRWVFSHIWRYKFYVLTFLVTIVLSNALFSASSRIIGWAFDEVLKPDPSRQQLLNITLILLVLALVQGLVYLAANLSIEVVGQRLERDARDELYLSLLGKSQTFHNRQRVGDIMARATEDVRQLNPMINPGIFLIMDALMSLIMPLLFIGFLRVELLLSPLIFVVIFYFALRSYIRQLNPVAGQMRWQFGVMNAGLTEAVTGIEVVKSAAQEVQEKRKFLKNASLYRDFFVKEGQVQARYLPILFFSLAFAGAFLHGLLRFSQGQLSVGDFVAFMTLVSFIRFPTFISIFTFSLVQLGLAGARRIMALMKEETDLDEN